MFFGTLLERRPRCDYKKWSKRVTGSETVGFFSTLRDEIPQHLRFKARSRGFLPAGVDCYATSSLASSST